MKHLHWMGRWPLCVVAAISTLVLFAIVSILLANLHQQRRAIGLLETLRRYQVGKSRSVEVLELTRSFDLDTEISVWIDEPSQSRIGRERLPECETAGCSINITLLLPGQYVGKDWFPRDNETLRRYLPQKGVLARIGVKKGVVTRVSALLESHDDKPYEAASVMSSSEDTAGPQDSSQWSIYQKSGIFTGGYWGGNFNSLNVAANESVPSDRVRRFFDFNPKCLGLWTHCSACEMLELACKERTPTR